MIPPEPTKMTLTKAELTAIIRDELERLRAELGEDLHRCLTVSQELDLQNDRLRPEDDTIPGPTTNGVLGEKARKTQHEKNRTKDRYKRRQEEEAKRARRFGGKAVMDSVGVSLSEEELEEKRDKDAKSKPRAKRGQHTKPGKGKPNCSPGQPYHSKTTGRFIDPSDESGSWSILAKGKDCSRGQFKRTGANKSTKFVKRPCGGEARKVGVNRKCADGKIHENWRRFVEQTEREEDTITFEGGKTMTRAELQHAIGREVKGLLANYEKHISQRQKYALQNTKALSDDKLQTFCDSFGYTTLRDYLTQTNSISVLVSNIVSPHGKQSQSPEDGRQKASTAR